MELSLREYQDNLSNVNQESILLQEQSNKLNVKIKNRKVNFYLTLD
jgi:hypothetical protein